MAKKVWLFAVYIIIAVYILNMGFNFVSLPDAFLEINKWFLGAAGVLLVIDSFRFLKDTYGYGNY